MKQPAQLFSSFHLCMCVCIVLREADQVTIIIMRSSQLCSCFLKHTHLHACTCVSPCIHVHICVCMHAFVCVTERQKDANRHKTKTDKQ